MAITGSAGADLLFHRAMYMQAILQHDVAVDDDGDNAEDAQKNMNHVPQMNMFNGQSGKLQ